MGRSWDRYYDEAPEFHHNVYWSVEQDGEAAQIFPWKKTWAQWKESGNDTESLWTDPLFQWGNFIIMTKKSSWIWKAISMSYFVISSQEPCLWWLHSDRDLASLDFGDQRDWHLRDRCPRKTEVFSALIAVIINLPSILFVEPSIQFLKRPVWRKISICEINFNSKIQKSKLKRNLWDEIRINWDDFCRSCSTLSVVKKESKNWSEVRWSEVW